MVRIELEPDEAEALRAICDESLSDLRTEIAHTDNTDFRESLKTRKAVLERLLARLEAGRQAP